MQGKVCKALPSGPKCKESTYLGSQVNLFFHPGPDFVCSTHGGDWSRFDIVVHYAPVFNCAALAASSGQVLILVITLSLQQKFIA